MKSFNKHPIFFVTFIILLVAFVGLAVYDVILFFDNGKAVSAELSARKRFESAIKVDPSQAELEKSLANIVSLKERMVSIDRELSTDGRTILAPAPEKEAFAFQQRLRSIVEGWRAQAQQNTIEIDSSVDFALKKYTDVGVTLSQNELIEPLWKQVSVLGNIISKLYSSRTGETSVMRILSVQREMLPVETKIEEQNRAASGRNRSTALRATNTGDFFEVGEFISARKEGSISAMGYRIVFAGYTDSMRNFLTNLNKNDLMLTVRSVEVKPYVGAPIKSPNDVKKAEAEAANAPAASSDEAFAAAFAAQEGTEGEDGESPLPVDAAPVATPAEEIPIVSENVSEFTFVIEYVEIEKEADTSSEKNDESKKGE